ncbi:hypothetical protein EYF80_059154 [Liparis tanakae]|uniref:Uncharacterized protein n=1 Tax=Liparis tanakae TaxID=230148 RepID=A0A4Z2EQQ1_9TELE|nr:hypothetical protein EYF80_059154 [Liparis tanakae]
MSLKTVELTERKTSGGGGGAEGAWSAEEISSSQRPHVPRTYLHSQNIKEIRAPRIGAGAMYGYTRGPHHSLG